MPHYDAPTSLAQIFHSIADRAANPMPNHAFCEKCHLILINIPGVREMIADRIGENRVSEAPICRCEHDAAIEIRRKFISSGVPHQMQGDRPRQFDNFVEREGATDGFMASWDFTRESPENILTIVGDTGRGKSHLAEAICRDALGRDMSVRYEYVPHLLDRMRSTFNSREGENIENIIAVCAQAQVLVLDDLGSEKGSDFTQERLTSIVEQRIGRHAKTVITTNKTHGLLNDMGYERLASRLFAEGTREARVALLKCGDARLQGIEA